MLTNTNQPQLFDTADLDTSPKTPTKTGLQEIRHEGNTVKVTLLAFRSSKYTSLERTATRHFMDWQKVNHAKLGYKESEILKYESADADSEIFYYFTLVLRLIY